MTIRFHLLSLKTVLAYSLAVLALFTGLSGCDQTNPPPETPTDSAGDSDSDSDGTDAEREPLCDDEIEVVMSPVKKSLTIVLERSYLMFIGSFGTAVFGAVGELVHQMEDWVDLAFFVFPGKDCVDLDESNPEVQCSVSNNMLFGFGTENPGDLLDDELLGWGGIGFCGIEAMAPALDKTLDYLNSDLQRAGSDVLFVGASRAACDPSALPHPDPSCYCPTGRDCSESGLLCTNPNPAYELARSYRLAGYNLHFAMFSTDPQINGFARALALEAGTLPEYFANTHADIANEFDSARENFYSCQMELDWSSLPAELAGTQDQGLINFFLDDKPLAYNATCTTGAGWEWIDDTTLQLCPSTCDTLTNQSILSGVVIEASFGCDSIVADPQ